MRAQIFSQTWQALYWVFSLLCDPESTVIYIHPAPVLPARVLPAQLTEEPFVEEVESRFCVLSWIQLTSVLSSTVAWPSLCKP